jgi:hypothetical protein
MAEFAGRVVAESDVQWGGWVTEAEDVLVQGVL